ncbi:MAG: hypothetical protein ACYDCH_15240 [Gaiellaceae bacterium]
MLDFDSGIIERYAADLHRKAAARVTHSTIFGGLLGAAVGSTPFLWYVHTAIPHRYGYAALLAGVAAGAYLGYSLGESRAVTLRLQAQLALHQLRIEQALLARPPARPLPASPPEQPGPPAPVLAPFPLAASDEPPVSARLSEIS